MIYHYIDELPAWLPNGPIPILCLVKRQSRYPLWVTRLWMN